MDDDDDKMPSQGQIVDLPAIHSQMSDAEIKKNYFLKKKKKNLLEMSVTRAKRIVYEVFYLNNGFLKATTFNQKVGRHLILLLSTISEAERPKKRMKTYETVLEALKTLQLITTLTTLTTIFKG